MDVIIEEFGETLLVLLAGGAVVALFFTILEHATAFQREQEKTMREIIEHMGVGFLEILGVVSIITVFFIYLKNDGILYEMMADYMQSICGQENVWKRLLENMEHFC